MGPMGKEMPSGPADADYELTGEDLIMERQGNLCLLGGPSATGSRVGFGVRAFRVLA